MGYLSADGFTYAYLSIYLSSFLTIYTCISIYDICTYIYTFMHKMYTYMYIHIIYTRSYIYITYIYWCIFFVSVANSLGKELAILFSLFAATTSLLSCSRLEIRIPLLPLPCVYNQMSASTRQRAVYLQWFSISQGTNKDCKRCHRFIISGDEERKKIACRNKLCASPFWCALINSS